jgi:integrase
MARLINRLTEARVKNAKKPGLHADGLGLYLSVNPTGTKSWVQKFMLRGKARAMGLGPVHTVSLREARAAALENRKRLLAGIDPLDERDAARKAQQRETAKTIAFRTCAEQYIAANRAGWTAKHAAQWPTTLAQYAYDTIGALPVGDIETGHITAILTPIWTTKTETASRVRQRIEAILDFATTHGWRSGPNPARWKGHLENVLPKKAKIAATKHHAALPWSEVGGFMAAVKEQKGVAALALQFCILTATRTGETLGAKWSEIDRQSCTWVIPTERMKARREHRVPLDETALAVLRQCDKLRDGDYVFPGAKAGAPLIGTGMVRLLERMGRTDITVHGFRSTFRDWCAETGKREDLAEAALAHFKSDKTAAAYQRSDLLSPRRRLMTDWGLVCAGKSTGVVRQLRQDNTA